MRSAALDRLTMPSCLHKHVQIETKAACAHFCCQFTTVASGLKGGFSSFLPPASSPL